MARRRWRRAGDLPCRECRSQHRRRVLGGPGEREGCSAGHGGLCLRCLPHVGGVSRVPQIAGTRATPDDGGTPSDQTPPAVHPTTELELPHRPQSSWGRATPQGHPKRFVPLTGNTQPVLAACGCHPSWAATPWGSSAPQDPSGLWGLTVRGIPAETWHTHSTDDPKAGAPPSPPPQVSSSSSWRNAGCRNSKRGVWQERPRGFPTHVPSASFEAYKPKFWP